ncbi:MAG: dihydroorotate dehydrogenase (quinone), partial [Candidatus Thermoplasmatota archaeon]|nr:dihydroorotate dehydrogenase (quinone) [Candidatus Thermoplasmatota archaeon]
MGLMYRIFIRPTLVFQDSEKAHLRSVKMLRFLSNNRMTKFFLSTIYKPNKKLSISLFGSNFIHPFGLAAG